MKKEYRTSIILEKSKDVLGFKTNESGKPTGAMSEICKELVALGKLFQARMQRNNSRYFSAKAAADLFFANSPGTLRNFDVILKNARELAKTRAGYSPKKDGKGLSVEYRVASKLIADGFIREEVFGNMRIFANKADAEAYAKSERPKAVKKIEKVVCKKEPSKSYTKTIKTRLAPKTKIWNIPAPVKTGTKPEKAPKKPVEIINNVKVKYIPSPEYKPLVMSRDCRMAPEIRAVHCRAPVLENT